MILNDWKIVWSVCEMLLMRKLSNVQIEWVFCANFGLFHVCEILVYFKIANGVILFHLKLKCSMSHQRNLKQFICHTLIVKWIVHLSRAALAFLLDQVIICLLHFYFLQKTEMIHLQLYLESTTLPFAAFQSRRSRSSNEPEFTLPPEKRDMCTIATTMTGKKSFSLSLSAKLIRCS